MDDNTRKVIDHGDRIRACLKQTELTHVSVLEQIGILLALTEGLLDSVPLEKIADAQTAICAAMNGLAAELGQRFLNREEADDGDRAAIVKAIVESLKNFQPAPSGQALTKGE